MTIQKAISEISAFVTSAIRKVAHFFGIATLEDLKGLRPRSLRAAKPNPVQIAEAYPIYFTSPDGTGTPYVASHLFQPFALRHGVALKFVPDPEQDAVGKYGYVPADPEVVEIEAGSVLSGPGVLSPIQGNVSVIEVVLAEDIGAQQYEAITGVPDGGFIEGTEIGSTPVVVGDSGVYGAAEVDVWTSTGFVVRMGAGVPIIFQ